MSAEHSDCPFHGPEQNCTECPRVQVPGTSAICVCGLPIHFRLGVWLHDLGGVIRCDAGVARPSKEASLSSASGGV